MSYTLQFLSRPYTVSYEVTSSCDLGCYFCSARLKEFGRHDLGTAEAIRILDTLIQEQVLSIFLTGGEPLLRSDIVDLVRHCTSNGVNTLVSTCGVGVGRVLATALFDAGLDEAQVSIHGVGTLHDQIVGVPGAFEAAMEGVDAFLSAGMRVTVAAVAARRNIHWLPELAREVAQVGVQHFRVQRLMPHSQELLRQVAPKSEFLAVARELVQIDYEPSEFEIHIHSTPGLLDESDVFEKREPSIVHPLTHTCSAGKTSMGILSNGDCVPCLELKDAEFLCGNLLSDSLESVWNAGPMKLLRDAGPATYKGRCAECELRWSCYSARCVAYHLNGNLLGDDISCYVLQAERDT
jgi:radical SAM protein with 4Fe4S-binding SPASM domain